MVAIGSISSNALVSSADIDSIFLSYGNEHNRAAGFLPAGTAVAAASASAVGSALALRDAAGGLTSTYGIATPNGGVAGFTVLGGTSFTSPAFSYSKTGQAAFTQINNDASVTAPAFHGPADTALALAVGATVAGGAIVQGSLTDDRNAGLWYTASATALKVHVASKNIWNQGSFIQFSGLDSPAISTAALSSGQARIDLLYVDPSGALQWQQGTPGPASSPPLPGNPATAFVPVMMEKTYFGATAVTGYLDQGHDSCMLIDARLPTTPFAASAIAAHSLSLTRLLEGAVYATSPASTTINAAALSYYNSGNAQIDYPGGTYTYANSALLNSQPRWDLLYNDDAANLSLAQGTPAASPAKPTFSTGQWPRALVYIPPNCTTIMDEAAYLAAGSPAAAGYIHFVPAYLAGNAPNAAATSATGTLTTSGSSPNIAVTAVTVTNSGSNGPYAVAPAVVFNGGTGTAATATANLVNGVVTSVTVNTGGLYSVAPTSVTFSATGGVQPVALGGTGAITAATARTNLGAAASGTNGDILVLNGLTGIAGNVTYTGNSTFQPTAVGNVPLVSKLFAGQTADAVQVVDSTGATVLAGLSPVGTIGQGGATAGNVGLRQSGTTGSALSGAYGVRQLQSLKPGATGGVAPFISVADGGTIDMSALTAVGNSVANAYGMLVNPLTRATSNPSVYAIDTLTPTGTVSGGTFTVSDGTNTTASINATDTVATINTKLTVAGGATPGAIAYTAAGAGPLSGGNAITFTANTANPGTKAILTLPANAVTGGGSIAFALTYAGAPFIGNAYGIYANAPTGGQANYAAWFNGQTRVGSTTFDGLVDGEWDGIFTVGKSLTGATNEGVASIQAQNTASASANGEQKNGLSVYVNNQVVSALNTNPVISVQHDLVALDVQANIGQGGTNTQGRIWGQHWQGSVINNGTTNLSDGNVVLVEAKIANPGVDGQYIGQTFGFAYQKVGITMFNTGPQAATAAYIVGNGGGAWHHAYWVDTTAVGTGTNDTAFEVGSHYSGGALINQGTFAVRAGGQTVIGKNLAVLNTDLLEIISTQTNGLTRRWDQFGRDYATGTVPTTTVNTGAGSTAGGTATCNAGSTDQYGSVTVATGTSAVVGAGATITSVNFLNSWPTTPFVTLTPANAAARDLAAAARPAVTTTTTAAFFITAGQTALTASTTYIWNYTVN